MKESIRKCEFESAKYTTLEREIRLLRGELRDEVILQVYRAEFLRSSGIRFAEGIYEDIEFRYETLKEAKVVEDSDDICYMKRIHQSSITADNALPENRSAYINSLLRLREKNLDKHAELALKHRVSGFLGLLAKELINHKYRDRSKVEEYNAIYTQWEIEKYLDAKSPNEITEREKLCILFKEAYDSNYGRSWCHSFDNNCCFDKSYS